MSQDCQTLLDKTHGLLGGSLKHARIAALAASLVPLATVAAVAQTSAPCEFYSGGLGMSLVDPVPELLSTDRQRITTVQANLATKGRWVAGVGADGVTQVVLRITGNFIPDGGSANPEQLTVTVRKNESDTSESVAEDGGLGLVGSQCPGVGCENHQVTVTTSCIDNTPQAFAIYRAPIDFARASADDSLAFRDVYIHIESPNGSGDFPLRIVRPPVALIHGIWADWTTWDDFSPLVTGRRTVDSRFSVLRVNYGWPVGSRISASTPAYPSGLRSRAKANALGFAFNAPGVLQQIRTWMNGFRSGQNPSEWPVAAVQADVVGHSMGGVITRTMALLGDFRSGTYGRGLVHKLITLNTPHLGSPLATRLLMPEQNGGCLQDKLARFGGSFAFQQVSLKGGATWPGATGDLVDSPLSQALQNITQAGPATLRAALIGGVYSNFASLSATVLKTICYDDPLAQSLNPTDYQAIFSNQANDGIVKLTSQQNNLTLDVELQIDDVLHSAGTRGLGFDGASVLESSSVVTLVIKLLNTPVTNTTYFVDLYP